MSQGVQGVTEQSVFSHNSETCMRIKEGSSITLAALAAIATITGCFLIMAQQGIPLGGLNAIFRLIEAKWVYLGTGLAASCCVISTAYLVSLRTSARKREESIQARLWGGFKNDEQGSTTKSVVPVPENPCYTKEESCGLRGPVSSEEYKCRQVKNGEYRTCDVISDSGQTTIYVLVMNQNHDKTSLDFKTKEGRQKYIQSLEGMVDQRELLRAISPSKKYTQILWSDFNKYCPSEEDFWPCEITVSGQNLFFVMTRGGRANSKRRVYFRSARSLYHHISKRNDSANGHARKLIDAHSLESKLTIDNPQESVVSLGCTYLFYRVDGKIQWQISLKEFGDAP